MFPQILHGLTFLYCISFCLLLARSIVTIRYSFPSRCGTARGTLGSTQALSKLRRQRQGSKPAVRLMRDL